MDASLKKNINQILKISINEDKINSDITGKLLLSSKTISSEIKFKQGGIICGSNIVDYILNSINKRIKSKWFFKEGAWVKKDTVVGGPLMNGMLDGCDGASVDIMSDHQRQAAHRPVPVDVPRSSCRGESFFISKNASVFLKKSMRITVNKLKNGPEEGCGDKSLFNNFAPTNAPL